MASTQVIDVGSLTILILLILAMYMAALFERKRYPIGHETTVIILISMLLSYVGYLIDPTYNKMIKFDDKVFFYACLPPIVFAAGYNMKRKKFFENI